MTPKDELRQAVVSLQAALRRSNLTQREVSIRLGQHPNYLSQVFSGKTRLREDVVVEVLDMMGIEIHDFYAELDRERAAEPDVQPGPVNAEEARRFIREALSARKGTRHEGPRPAPPSRERGAAGHCARVLELLRLKIRQVGLRQRAISRALGEHPDYLSQVLRGNVALKVEFVLAVLRRLGTTPAAFYAELAGPLLEPRVGPEPKDEIARGVTWGEILALIDEEIESTRERKAQRNNRAEAAPTPTLLTRRTLRAS